MSQVKSKGSRFGKLGNFKFKPAMPGLSIYVDRVNIDFVYPLFCSTFVLFCLFDNMT